MCFASLLLVLAVLDTYIYHPWIRSHQALPIRTPWGWHPIIRVVYCLMFLTCMMTLGDGSVLFQRDCVIHGRITCFLCICIGILYAGRIPASFHVWLTNLDAKLTQLSILTSSEVSRPEHLFSWSEGSRNELAGNTFTGYCSYLRALEEEITGSSEKHSVLGSGQGVTKSSFSFSSSRPFSVVISTHALRIYSTLSSTVALTRPLISSSLNGTRQADIHIYWLGTPS